MDFVFVGTFLLILGFLAWGDWKTRKLADLDLALLWGILFIPFLFEAPEAIIPLFAIAGGGFAVVYLFFFALPTRLLKKPLLRSGDIILYPPVLAFCYALGGILGIQMAVLALGFSLIISFKKSLPFATVLFIYAVCLAIAASVSGLTQFA